jgi:ribokinase
MVGRVGHDAFSSPLLQNLAAAQVDHTYVIRDSEAATGVALIEVDDRGENSIVVASGANMRLSPADVDAAEAVIAAADALLLQLENPLETVTHAAEVARAHGIRVILNPAPARLMPAELFSLADVLIPNESETALLADMPVRDHAEAQAAATALRESGVDTVILTLGERGALLAHAGETVLFPAFEVTPIDTTAAGDAFVAGFAVALAEGKSVAEAARWGNASGALATTQLGAQPSLPTREVLEKFLNTTNTKSA